MKKLCLGFVMLVLVGCGNEKSETPKQAIPAPAIQEKPVTPSTAKNITINQIITQFKADGLPVGKVLEQTAESDPNHRLGRPNEYIASAQFEDTRIKQVKPDSSIQELGLPKGGTIEIFNNPTDLEVRKKYIESAYQALPQAKQYIFVKGNVLLRLEFEMTPMQANAYKSSLDKVA